MEIAFPCSERSRAQTERRFHSEKKFESERRLVRCQKRKRSFIIADSIQCKENLWDHAFEKERRKDNIYVAVLDSWSFKFASFVVVLTSSLWIGVTLDWPEQSYGHLVENFFCVFFLGEALLLVLSNKTRDASVIFDCSLAALSVVDTWVMPALLNTLSLKSLAVLRIVRLFRVLRLGRVINRIPEIMVVLRGLMLSARGVFAVMLLEAFVLYSAAITLRVLSDETPLGAKYFQSVHSAMMTLLLRCVVSGSRCFNLLEEAQTQPVSMLALFVFVLVGNITIMGILTGLMVQTIRSTSILEREKAVIIEIDRAVDTSWHSHGTDVPQDLDFVELLLRDESLLTCLHALDVDPGALFYELSLLFEVQFAVTKTDLKKLVLNSRGSEPALARHHVETRRFVRHALDQQASDAVRTPRDDRAAACQR